MSMKTPLVLATCAFVLIGCGDKSAATRSDAAPMPTPTVSSQSVDMPAGTQLSTLSMINAKIRKPVDGRPTAGYLIIENSGATSERLTALTSPDFGRVELHESKMEGNVMKMAKLDGLDIAPMSQAMMEPGGKHIMLFDAKRELKNGDSIKITLTFSNSGPIETNFVVLNEIPPSRGAPSMPGHDMSGMPKN